MGGAFAFRFLRTRIRSSSGWNYSLRVMRIQPASSYLARDRSQKPLVGYLPVQRPIGRSPGVTLDSRRDGWAYGTPGGLGILPVAPTVTFGGQTIYWYDPDNTLPSEPAMPPAYNGHGCRDNAQDVELFDEWLGSRVLGVRLGIMARWPTLPTSLLP